MSARHQEEETLSEPLVFREYGTKGCLRFPKKFTDEYDFVGPTLPIPIAKLEKRDGKVRLIYEWTDAQLSQAAKDAEKFRKDRRNQKKTEQQ